MRIHRAECWAFTERERNYEPAEIDKVAVSYTHLGFESGIDGFTLGEKMQQSAERFGAVTELAEVYKVSLSGRIKTLDTSEGVFQSLSLIHISETGWKRSGA